MCRAYVGVRRARCACRWGRRLTRTTCDCERDDTGLSGGVSDNGGLSADVRCQTRRRGLWRPPPASSTAPSRSRGGVGTRLSLVSMLRRIICRAACALRVWARTRTLRPSACAGRKDSLGLACLAAWTDGEKSTGVQVCGCGCDCALSRLWVCRPYVLSCVCGRRS